MTHKTSTAKPRAKPKTTSGPRTGIAPVRALAPALVNPEAPDVQARIAELAQARYVSAASLDAAVSLAMLKRGQPAPSGAELARKLTIDPEAVRLEFFVRVAEGESVYTICQDAHMPARTTIYKRLSSDPGWTRDYQTAMLLRADKYVEQINDLSREAVTRAAMGASTEEITAIKLAVNSLQWTAARLNPQKYGDRQLLDIDAKVVISEDQADARLAALFAKTKARVIEASE